MPEPLAGSAPALAGWSVFSVLQDVSADFECSVCCGLSGVHCQCHRASNRSCPYTPSELGRTYWRAFEPWGDNSLRHDWCGYWCWVHRNHLYYVGIWAGGVTFALAGSAKRGHRCYVICCYLI